MSRTIEFVSMAALSAQQETALNMLHDAVYPPQVLAALSEDQFTWTSSQWSILLWEEGKLVTHVGMVERAVLSNGTPKQIGGVGGVMTHPLYQGKGLAGQALQAAAERFATDFDVAYALLVCRPELVPFYSRAQWKPFGGQFFVEQPSGKIDFSAMGPMVLDIKEQAPRDGTIDLQGLPW